MAELTVDLTYGSALFQAAEETGKKDLIMDEACQVLGIFEQEPAFYAFINYPAISAREKKDVLKNVFEGNICQEPVSYTHLSAVRKAAGTPMHHTARTSASIAKRVSPPHRRTCLLYTSL